MAPPLATLAAVGFSLMLFVQLLILRTSTRTGLLLHNTLGKLSRTRLLASLAIALVVPVIAGLIVILRRPLAMAKVERVAALLAPLALLFVMVPLVNLNLANEKTLIYLMLLGAFGLMLEPLMRRALEAGRGLSLARPFSSMTSSLPRVPRWAPFAVVLAAGLAYGIVNSYFTIQNHHRLGTTAFDLGIYDNLMYNALHGHPFRSPVLFGPAGGNYIAGHAEFAMLLFVPIYAIHPGPEMMLAIQSFVLGLAAVPLYLFGKTLLPRPTAALVAIGYLFFAPLHGPNYYDFHWLPLAIFFHFWLYYAIARRKYWLCAAMVVILFAIREDVAVGIAVLGLFLLLTRTRPLLGLILMVSAVVWFGIDRFIIMPAAGSWYFQTFYSNLFADGESSYKSVLRTILSNPIYFLSTIPSDTTKLTYALHMLAPLVFLPVRRAATALFVLPGFVFTIMTNDYAPVLSISFQYTTHWIPYMFLGVVLGLCIIDRQRGALARQAAVLTFAVVLLCHSFCYGAILQHQRFVGGFAQIPFMMTDAEKLKYQALRAMLKKIPPSASVAATEQEAAHVGTRRTMYPLRWPPGPVDYLLVGRSHIGGLSRAPLDAAFSGESYGVIDQYGDELFLFRRGPATPGTSLAKQKLGVPSTGGP
jgi:uncharacterized membrane protein